MWNTLGPQLMSWNNIGHANWWHWHWMTLCWKWAETFLKVHRQIILQWGNQSVSSGSKWDRYWLLIMASHLYRSSLFPYLLRPLVQPRLNQWILVTDSGRSIVPLYSLYSRSHLFTVTWDNVLCSDAQFGVVAKEEGKRQNSGYGRNSRK